MTDTWQHETKKAMVTPEEAYMLKKQQGLQIHFIPCAKLRSRFDQVTISNVHQDITHTEFCAILASLKLLKADLPRTDERWINFYKKFVIVDANEGEEDRIYNERYSTVPTLIALTYLSQGSPDVKSKAICELFTQQQFLEPEMPGISKWTAYRAERQRLSESYELSLDETMLSKE